MIIINVISKTTLAFEVVDDLDISSGCISPNLFSSSFIIDAKKIHKIFKNGQYLEDFDLFLPFFVVKYVIT